MTVGFWFALYNVVLHVGVVACAPFWFAVRFFRGRYKGQFRERMGLLSDDVRGRFGHAPAIWVHAASAGETVAAEPLVRALKKTWPDRPIFFSVTSRYGKRMAENRLTDVVDAICFSPLDLPVFCRRTIGIVQPALYVMVETDIWPNLVRLVRGTCVLASGYASPRSFPRAFWSTVFRHIDLFSMQTDQDASNMVRRGALPERVEVGGNLKFDGSGVAKSAEEVCAIRKRFNIPEGVPVFVAGSTLAEDEAPVLDAIAALRTEGIDLHAIVAPRRQDRVPEVLHGLLGRGVPAELRTAARAAPVIVLDTMGELADTYSIASIAYVGGGLTPDVGLHNLIEPLVGGAPVLFGPHRGKAARVVREIMRTGAGVELADGSELLAKMRSVLIDDVERRRLVQAGHDLLDLHRGAAERQAQAIRAVFESERESESS